MLLKLSNRDHFKNLISRFVPDLQIMGQVTVGPKFGALQVNIGGQDCYVAPLTLNCLNYMAAFKASQLTSADLPYQLQLSAFEIVSKDFFEKLSYILGPCEVVKYLNYQELSALSLADPLWATLQLSFDDHKSEKYEEVIALYPKEESIISSFLDKLEQNSDLITTKKTLSANLKATAYVLIDSIELTLGQLKSLNVGDALMFNSFINNDRFTIKCLNEQAIGVLNTSASNAFNDDNHDLDNDDLKQESSFDDHDNIDKAGDNLANSKDYYLILVEPFSPIDNLFLEGKDMSFDNLDNVPLTVDLVLSSFDMNIGDLKSLNTGSRLPLHNDSLSNIKVYVNHNLVALAKVIDIDGTYALQIKELINNQELLEKKLSNDMAPSSDQKS